MFEDHENNLDVPLDLFVGLLCQMQIRRGDDIFPGDEEPGIFELQFENNYSRVSTTQMDWITPDGITMYNASELLFPWVTFDWGLITHFGLWLTEKDEDCLCVGELSVPKNIRRTNRVCFQIKTIDINIEHLALEYEQYKFGGENGKESYESS